MCLQDYAMARHSRTAEYHQAISNAAHTLLVPENPDRVAIVISPPPSGNLLISIGNETGTTLGIILNSGGLPLRLSLWDNGDLVTKRFTAIHSAGSVTIGVWDTFLQINRGALLAEWAQLGMRG